MGGATPLTAVVAGFLASSAFFNLSSNSCAFLLALSTCSNLACSSSCLLFLALSAAACISRVCRASRSSGVGDLTTSAPAAEAGGAVAVDGAEGAGAGEPAMEGRGAVVRGGERT